MEQLPNYHRLNSIEDVDEFYSAISRSRFVKKLSDARPYTYWTIELYDQKNGIRGGGGLGILAADTRRVAEQLHVPFVLLTPFYPRESHQVPNSDGRGFHTELTPVDYRDFGFHFIDSVFVKCCGNLCKLDVIEKVLGTTRILSVTEPNFGELYSGLSGADHRLYQEISLGFGGYQALKLIGKKPALIQLNEVATFFAALARLDELASSGMDFYEAVVYTRKHTLYTNHTLVQAAEANFSYDQFERFVFPNLRSRAVRKWLSDKFADGHIRLSSVAIEIAELRSGVSKLHARVADYRDINGEKVRFSAVTNGIDLRTWLLPEIYNYYHNEKILDRFDMPAKNFTKKLEILDAATIRALKAKGRAQLNDVLSRRTDQYGRHLYFTDREFIFDFKRRFVDYKRPWLPFSDPVRLRHILEDSRAHYIFAGRVHEGDSAMYSRLTSILSLVDADPFLRTHVHYLPDYDEELAYALSVGSNASINIPIVGLEACGTSWEKDIANFDFLISTHDGGVADAPADSYFNVSGSTEAEEVESLYSRMSEAAAAWNSDFDLEFYTKKQLANYLPVISGSRMLRDYLILLFS